MTSRIAGRPRVRDRRATEQELVSAAAIVFAEKGYERATTRSIAEAAGCSEGLIQRYFNGKEGLLLAVLKRTSGDRRQQFFERPLCPSIEEEAREMIKHATEAFVERSERMRIVLGRVLLDRTFQGDFQRISTRRDVQAGLKKRLARYIEAGMVDPALDAAVMTEMLMALIFQLGFVHREIHLTPAAELRRLTDGFVKLFARAVSPASVPRKKKETREAVR